MKEPGSEKKEVNILTKDQENEMNSNLEELQSLLIKKKAFEQQIENIIARTERKTTETERIMNGAEKQLDEAIEKIDKLKKKLNHFSDLLTPYEEKKEKTKQIKTFKMS
ncbi:MAG: hypothetical protein V4439_03250 [Patescibacteria group bacterium]